VNDLGGLPVGKLPQRRKFCFNECNWCHRTLMLAAAQTRA
jgi:hypothetical protein